MTRIGGISVLILATSSELTSTAHLFTVLLVMAGITGIILALAFVDGFSGKMAFISLACGLLMFLAAILYGINGPHEEHIKVDGRTVDWESIAREEYRTEKIEGTIVELVKNNDI